VGAGRRRPRTLVHLQAVVAQLLTCSARLSALNLRGNRIGDAGGERPFWLGSAYVLRVLVMK
jgi:hypothetical protein